jgi:hypothetical protein
MSREGFRFFSSLQGLAVVAVSFLLVGAMGGQLLAEIGWKRVVLVDDEDFTFGDAELGSKCRAERVGGLRAGTAVKLRRSGPVTYMRLERIIPGPEPRTRALTPVEEEMLRHPLKCDP